MICPPRKPKSTKKAQEDQPCLWFDDQAEDAARFYTGIFKYSRIVTISHYQVVPQVLPALLNDPDTAKSQRAFQAMMRMKKLNIQGSQRVFDGT